MVDVNSSVKDLASIDCGDPHVREDSPSAGSEIVQHYADMAYDSRFVYANPSSSMSFRKKHPAANFGVSCLGRVVCRSMFVSAEFSTDGQTMFCLLICACLSS